MEPILNISNLELRYPGSFRLSVTDFELQAREVMALVGESGCGKTSLLRTIAGFERNNQGSISLQGKEVAGQRVWLAPEKRKVGMVFQDYALFPHMRVDANVAYGLQKQSKPEQQAQVAEALELVGLAGYERRYPHELSGGQQQRVALARALAPRPALLLLDEPFSNLDSNLKEQVRQEIKSILHKAGIAALLVTHDPQDAIEMADRIAVMHQGSIEQIDSPVRLYEQPRSARVARFFGKVSLIAGEQEGGILKTPFGEWPIDASKGSGYKPKLMLRPEHILLSETGSLEGQVQHCTYQGGQYLITISVSHRLGGLTLQTFAPGALQVGELVKLQLAPGAGHLIYTPDQA